MLLFVSTENTVELTRSLSHQVGAVHALPWEERGTWECEKVGKKWEQVHLFDCQSRPSSSAGPDNSNGTHIKKILNKNRNTDNWYTALDRTGYTSGENNLTKWGSPLKLKGPTQGTGRSSVAERKQRGWRLLLWSAPQSPSHCLYSQPLPLSQGEHILWS